MKALIASFGFLVSSVFVGDVALASKNVFTYRTVLVEQSKSGRFCPELVTANAVDQLNSTRGQALHLVDARGYGAVYTYEVTTRVCKEDIRCDSTNHYLNASSHVNVSMKLNNNGEYPTTDLPGYTSLKLSWVDPQTSTAKYCVYMLL